MRGICLCAIFGLLLIIFLTVPGCITSTKAQETVTTIPDPTPGANHGNITINTTITAAQVPARPNLTEEDKAFFQDAIQIQAICIYNISETLAAIKNHRYDDARTMAESTEKLLKSHYTNLSERTVSPTAEPIKEEILEAIRDEINGTHKLKYIAISDSEIMYSASKDYTAAADGFFISANVHLNAAQSKIDALTK
jgi:hypothetical protein